MTKAAPTKRAHVLRVPATDQEIACIDARAGESGLPRAAYMRRVAMGAQATTKVDRDQIKALLNLQADLGRLGGLLKHWIALDERQSGPRPHQLHAAFDEVLRKILSTQAEVLSAAKDLRRALR